MARSPSALVVLALGLAATTLVGASPQRPGDSQEEQDRKFKCDFGCYNSALRGSCAEDPACVCRQNAYREEYFCCMTKCDPTLELITFAVDRFHAQCNEFKMPFTFDAPKVCGVGPLPTSLLAPVSPSSTSPAASATAQSASSSSLTVQTTPGPAASVTGSTGAGQASSSSTAAGSATAAGTSASGAVRVLVGSGAAALLTAGLWLSLQ